MSEKKDIRIVCDRCGQEVQSANAAYFRAFYVENQSSIPHTLAEYKFTARNRNTTYALVKPGLGYVMRGTTMTLNGLTGGTVDLCAACAESLSEWWGTGDVENGGDPFKHCGLERAR